jgi:hypothetical protein
MISEKDIEKTILWSCGNPSVGPIHDNATTIAQAIHRLVYPKADKENRIITAEETPEKE